MNKRLLNIIKTNFDHYLEEQLNAPAFASRFERAGEAWDAALQLIESDEETANRE